MIHSTSDSWRRYRRPFYPSELVVGGLHPRLAETNQQYIRACRVLDSRRPGIPCHSRLVGGAGPSILGQVVARFRRWMYGLNRCSVLTRSKFSWNVWQTLLCPSMLYISLESSSGKLSLLVCRSPFFETVLIKCMLNNCLEWYKWVSTNLYTPDSV